MAFADAFNYMFSHHPPTHKSRAYLTYKKLSHLPSSNSSNFPSLPHSSPPSQQPTPSPTPPFAPNILTSYSSIIKDTRSSPTTKTLLSQPTPKPNKSPQSHSLSQPVHSNGYTNIHKQHLESLIAPNGHYPTYNQPPSCSQPPSISLSPPPVTQSTDQTSIINLIITIQLNLIPTLKSAGLSEESSNLINSLRSLS